MKLTLKLFCMYTFQNMKEVDGIGKTCLIEFAQEPSFTNWF